jgi:hypothetical protein
MRRKNKMKNKQDRGMTRREFLERNGCALALFGVAGAFTGMVLFEKYEYKFSHTERHPVDQVFRDHNGYRVRWTSANGVDVEVKYLSSRRTRQIQEIPPEILSRFTQTNGIVDEGVKIIRDLDDERGFAQVLHYDGMRRIGQDFKETYAEIHLPKSQRVSPGNEVWGGKNKKYDHMGEIK